MSTMFVGQLVIDFCVAIFCLVGGLVS